MCEPIFDAYTRRVADAIDRRSILGVVTGLAFAAIRSSGTGANPDCESVVGNGCSDQGFHGFPKCCKPLVCVASECQQCVGKGGECHKKDCCHGFKCKDHKCVKRK